MTEPAPPAATALLCFWCLTEMCDHAKPEGSDFRHPAKGPQQVAVTAYNGTPLCGSCALDFGRKLVRHQADQAKEEPAGG
jgi:hypothetical protein